MLSPLPDGMTALNVTHPHNPFSLWTLDNNSEIMPRNTNNYTISAEPESEECIYALTNDKEIIEPSTTAEALQDPMWKKSMDDEMKALHDKETWEVITPLSNANIVSSKWVYTCKRDSTGRVV